MQIFDIADSGTDSHRFVGIRFDVAVAQLLGISRAKAGKLIAGGQARLTHLSGRSYDKASILEQGDSIEVDDRAEQTAEPFMPQQSPSEATAGPFVELPIVFEDDDIVVVDKPAGVAAHRSANWAGPTVVDSLAAQGVAIEPCGDEGREGIVSRLDVGTSGLMLVCKSAFAYAAMKEQFAQHTVTKIYHSLVQGNLANGRATIEAPIGRSKVSDFRFSVMPEGKSAVTHYQILERLHGLTLVEVNLETGRTHQIRVHFSSIGHPLAGDTMYGANPAIARELGLTRQWLHSMRLEFEHPRTGVHVSLESHYPADLAEALTHLH
jgi:23S rRNA pseudouridine1911/1915/1917 synthase